MFSESRVVFDNTELFDVCGSWNCSIVLRLSSVLAPFTRIVGSRPMTTLIAAVATGMLLWGGFNWSLELTNTEAFCISCHAMNEFVYKEYTASSHYANRTGVRASCPDCHVPKEWVHKVVRKIHAVNELLQWARGTIDTKEEFESRRPKLAGLVWQGMTETDSRECRNCHDFAFMNPDRQATRAVVMHGLADKWDYTCIRCHKGIVHSLPADFDHEAGMDALHDRMEEEKIGCRQCHEGMAAPPRGQGWD